MTPNEVYVKLHAVLSSHGPMMTGDLLDALSLHGRIRRAARVQLYALLRHGLVQRHTIAGEAELQWEAIEA